MPIGALATVESDAIELVAVVLSLDGCRSLRASKRGANPEALGRDVVCPQHQRSHDLVLGVGEEEPEGAEDARGGRDDHAADPDDALAKVFALAGPSDVRGVWVGGDRLR